MTVAIFGTTAYSTMSANVRASMTTDDDSGRSTARTGNGTTVHAESHFNDMTSDSRKYPLAIFVKLIYVVCDNVLFIPAHKVTISCDLLNYAIENRLILHSIHTSQHCMIHHIV